MNVLYFIIPVSLLFALGIAVVFILATLNGQWDDLDTPAHRILLEDQPVGDNHERS